MKYLIFGIIYILSFFVLFFWVLKKNKIDNSDYRNRKKEIKRQASKMLENYLLSMLVFNLVSAIIYKLLSFQFLTFRSIVAAIFYSFVQSTFIALFHPKIINFDVCWIERLVIVSIPPLIFIFCIQRGML